PRRSTRASSPATSAISGSVEFGSASAKSRHRQPNRSCPTRSGPVRHVGLEQPCARLVDTEQSPVEAALHRTFELGVIEVGGDEDRKPLRHHARAEPSSHGCQRTYSVPSRSATAPRRNGSTRVKSLY